MNACWKTDRFEKQNVLMTFVTGVGRNFRQELPFDRRSSHCGLERSQTTNAHPALGHSVQFVAFCGTECGFRTPGPSAFLYRWMIYGRVHGWYGCSTKDEASFMLYSSYTLIITILIPSDTATRHVSFVIGDGCEATHCCHSLCGAHRDRNHRGEEAKGRASAGHNGTRHQDVWITKSESKWINCIRKRYKKSWLCPEILWHLIALSC